jgi:hypothetical protein
VSIFNEMLDQEAVVLPPRPRSAEGRIQFLGDCTHHLAGCAAYLSPDLGPYASVTQDPRP